MGTGQAAGVQRAGPCGQNVGRTRLRPVRGVVGPVVGRGAHRGVRGDRHDAGCGAQARERAAGHAGRHAVHDRQHVGDAPARGADGGSGGSDVAARLHDDLDTDPVPGPGDVSGGRR